MKTGCLSLVQRRAAPPAFHVDIGTLLDQQRRSFFMPINRRDMKRCDIMDIACIHVCAIINY